MQLQRLRVDPPRLQPQLLLQRRGEGIPPPAVLGWLLRRWGVSTPPGSNLRCCCGGVDPKAQLHPPNCGFLFLW